ncbi:aminotransferase class V-fold PLP-dependent enzyme [Alkalihalobacillus hwajinpoensis]|uniref:aminotransferase class V-fold PLP-dependent enzyme n=1 Tax=Guptibacillus hwajinpoensis TaxID=208199 RepID=UPI001883C516|nr:aminotransferase class V-fold PLP-dependent enzyme [Pseudalkalibacillus hwajinpoensis]MBF0704987.1 aminotransferase class V-fold PLP-dependent enzyme [Pseudalkalibacillus hwajinpoensis]
MIYLDQAATSFPKPPEVVQAMTECMTEYAANPGRGGHALSKRADNMIVQAREQLADFFGFDQPERVCFTANATGALNQAIKGFSFNEGDHVLTTSYEHNSVRRPLEYMKKTSGIEVDYINLETTEEFDVEAFCNAVRPSTKMIIVSHGSNLTGKIIPIDEIGKIAREQGITFLVDASQTAGIIPIHMEQMSVDLLAFPGHKGLLGPQGTGVLMVSKAVELNPIYHGGTGSSSELVDQPLKYPERLESGTVNTPGIAGLLAGLHAVKKMGLHKIRMHELHLTEHLINGLKEINYVKVYGPNKERLGVIPFTIEGIDAQEIAIILDQHYEIAVRAGLHCTPLGHETIGTSTTGAVRLSVGPYNTIDEINKTIQAVEEIVEGYFG